MRRWAEFILMYFDRWLPWVVFALGVYSVAFFLSAFFL